MVFDEAQPGRNFDATHTTLIGRIREAIFTANRVVANLPAYLTSIGEK